VQVFTIGIFLFPGQKREPLLGAAYRHIREFFVISPITIAFSKLGAGKKQKLRCYPNFLFTFVV